MIMDFFNVCVVGVNGWMFWEDYWFDSFDFGVFEGCFGLFISDGLGVFVGDNDDFCIIEEFFEDVFGFFEYVVVYDYDVCVVVIG